MATRTATTHTFYIGAGDQLPFLREQILQSNKQPLDLSVGLSNLTMSLWKVDSGALTVVSFTAVFIAVPTLEAQGWVECQWGVGGIAAEGEYVRKWSGQLSGKPWSMPNYIDTGYNVIVT